MTPSWVVPVATVLGALLVSAANIIVNRWRYGIDRLSISVDYFCDEVNSAADLATSYWVLDLSVPGDHYDAKRTESFLIGRQDRIQELLLIFLENPSINPGINIDKFEKERDDLFDAMTGGSFKTKGRSPDYDRAPRVQAVAAKLNGHARRALEKSRRRWRL